MKIKDKKFTNTRKKALIAVGVAVILGVATSAYWYTQKSSDDFDTERTIDEVIESTEPAPEKLSDEDAKAKKDYVENYKDPTEATDTAQDNASVRIIPSQEGSTVVIRTQLASITDGTCSLTVTNGQKRHTETAEVLYQPMHSTCKGFSIPVSHLGPGNWSISLQTTSLTNQSVETEATIEVKS